MFHLPVACASASLLRFRRDEAGASTIEFALWVPLIASLMVLITNGTMAMQTQTVLYDAARDAARSVATSNATTAEAEAKLTTRFAALRGVTADVSITDGFVTAHMSAPFTGVIGLGDLLSALTLNASVTMWMEQDT